jgi:hypothetical protein
MNRRNGGLRLAAGAGVRAAPLALLLAGACPAALQAQTAPPPSQSAQSPGAPAPAQAGPPAPPPQPAPRRTRPPEPAEAEDADEADATVAEVVVNGRRTQVGAVVGDIKPEIQLTPADIQSFGVSTITELLAELGPEVRSDRGRGGGQPVILLNGRRISSFHEIENVPTEAILRVDILPEEVSLKYGYTADQRVVNIVLRRRFRAITGEVKGGGATEGGQVAGGAEGDLLRLRGDNRLNLDLKTQASSNLTYADRGLSGVGRSGAQAPAGEDPAADRTLSPASRQLTLNGVWSHSVLGGFAVTLNGNLSTSQSDALQGLPAASLSVPAGDPFATSPQAVTVYRHVPGFGPLAQTTNGWTGHLGLTVNKDAFGWRFSFTSAYDHSDSLTVTQTGLDASAAQALLNAPSPSFDPYGTLSKRLFTERPYDEARALSDTGNAQFLGNGPLLKLPAGDLYASLKLGDTIGGFSSSAERAGATDSGFLWRNALNAQLNLDLPLLKHSFGGGWGVFGDLSLNGNLAVDQLSDFGTLTTLGYGANWTPVKGVNLIVSRTIDHLAPTVQQLGDPQVVTPGVPVYDALTGQSVEVTTISGGNPKLKADTRDVFKVGLTLKPWEAREFTATVNYVRSDIKNPILSIPGSATPQMEALFPNAYVRDPQGQLIEVDETAQNFADQARQEVRWGFNWAIPLAAPKPATGLPQLPPPRRDGGSGGEHSWHGGGGGYGRFRGARQGRFQVALYHTVFFQDRILAAPGLPALDLLNGGAVGAGGGQFRHEVEGQLGWFKSGFGVRVSANWKSATKVEGGTPASDLDFADLGTLNLRLWDNFGAQPELVRKWRWLRGSRVTFEVVNLFDTRQGVRDALGATPLAYQPAYLNPAGRTVQIHLRKLFF